MPRTTPTTCTTITDLDATLAVWDWASKRGAEAWERAQKLRPRGGVMRYRVRALRKALEALEEAHRYWDLAMYAARVLGPLLTRERAADAALWESIGRELENDRRDFPETSSS